MVVISTSVRELGEVLRPRSDGHPGGGFFSYWAWTAASLRGPPGRAVRPACTAGRACVLPRRAEDLRRATGAASACSSLGGTSQEARNSLMSPAVNTICRLAP